MFPAFILIEGKRGRQQKEQRGERSERRADLAQAADKKVVGPDGRDDVFEANIGDNGQQDGQPPWNKEDDVENGAVPPHHGQTGGYRAVPCLLTKPRALGAKHVQASFASLIVLSGSLRPPFKGLALVLLHPLARIVHGAENHLGVGISLFG